MVPDKIYIGRVTLSSNEPGEQHLLPGWHKRPNPKITNTEYIRKDALLEWAKAEIKLSKRVECISEKSYEEGRQQVAQNLIDKLNSM